MTLEYVAEATIQRPDGRNTLKYPKAYIGDIIKETITCLLEERDQVKNFAGYLKAGTLLQTCNNVWDFIKDNIHYDEDPEGKQYVQEPGRLWWSKSGDCKSYAVMAASLLYNLGINCWLRFVSYEKGQVPTHVYVVVPARDGSEIIIDPVVSWFNYQVPYKEKIDYPMSTTEVYRLSGIPGRRVQKHNKRRYKAISGCCDSPHVGIAVEAAITVATAALKFISGFFGKHPNPNDWKGWDSQGRSAARWVLGDGDSVQNEAVNIIAFIQNKGGVDFFKTAPSWEPFEGQYVTPQKLYDKLSRGGYPDIARQLADALTVSIDPKAVTQTYGQVTTNPNNVNTGNGTGTYNPNTGTGTGTGTGSGSQPPPANEAGMSPLLIGGLVLGGLGLYFGMKGKKKRA